MKQRSLRKMSGRRSFPQFMLQRFRERAFEAELAEELVLPSWGSALSFNADGKNALLN